VCAFAFLSALRSGIVISSDSALGTWPKIAQYRLIKRERDKSSLSFIHFLSLFLSHLCLFWENRAHSEKVTTSTQEVTPYQELNLLAP
jgi:hypothetical protein